MGAKALAFNKTGTSTPSSDLSPFPIFWSKFPFLDIYACALSKSKLP